MSTLINIVGAVDNTDDESLLRGQKYVNYTSLLPTIQKHARAVSKRNKNQGEKNLLGNMGTGHDTQLIVSHISNFSNCPVKATLKL